MEGHAVAAMAEEQLKICRKSCWGTCEELLLVSAVKRHGGRNWNLVSEELKARSVSLNVSPRYFSEAACKEKYDILRERYTKSSSSCRSRSEDLGNDTDWCEELRRLRVAHLKRELIHYDGSVGTLQVKIKRLKAENSEDSLLSKQVRKTIKNSQSTEEVRGGSSCETSAHRSAGKFVDLHASPVVLVSKMDSEEDLWCQEPSNVRNQALPEGGHWAGASEGLSDASRAFSEKARVIVVKSSPPSSVIGSSNVEQGDEKKIAVLPISETSRYETPAVPGSLADDLRDVDADKVGASIMYEHPKIAITRTGYQLADGCQRAGSMVLHEAGDILSDALDNYKGNAVIMDGQQLPVKMNVLNDDMGSGHTDFGQEGVDRILEISAGSIVNTRVNNNGDSDRAATETHSKDVFFPIRPSSQLLLSSVTVGDAEDWNADLTTATVGRINLSRNEEGMDEMVKRRTVAIEDAYHSILEVDLNKQVHVALPLDLTKAESGVQLGRNLLECYAGIACTTPALNPILNTTRKTFNVSEGCHNLQKGLTSATLEVASCDQKELLWEEDSVKEVDTTLLVVKKLATFRVESEELDRCSDDVAGESVSRSTESEKILVSAVVPTMSLINLESYISRGVTTIILEKSDLNESASRSSGLSYKTDVAEGSPSPERHIVIALNGPGGTALNSEIVSIRPANGEDLNAYQIETPTRSDVVCKTQARRTVEELHISAVSSRIVDSCEEIDWETPATLNDLLEEVHMTGQANSLQSVSQVIHPVQCSDVASFTIVSPALDNAFESGESSPIVAVRVGHDAEMSLETAIHCDRQPCTLESSRGNFDPQASSAIHGVELAEIIGLVAEPDAFLTDIAEIRVEPRDSRGTCDEKHLQFCLGQSSELAISASLEVEGRQSSYNSIKKSPLLTLTADPDSRVVVETDQEVTVDTRQDGTDLKDVSLAAESKLPEIVLNMNLEYSKEGLSGVESDAEPSSPLESLAGGLYSMMPFSHERGDSVQGHYKDEPNDRNRGGIQQNGDNADSDVDKSEAGSPLVGPNEMSPSSTRYRKEPRVSRKLFPLLEVYRNLSNHKSAIFFKGRQEDPGYSSLIRRHLDLNSVRSRLDEGSYSSSSEFFRDLLLIFNNAMVYYTRGSVQFRGARALVAEATKEMNRVFRTESLLKQDRPATRTREVKKPIASAGVSIPRKIVVPMIGADSSGNSADIISPLMNLPVSGIRKRSSSRLGFVETLCNSHSEAVAAHSASASFLGGPSSSGAEDTEYYYRENDQEVNGRLKERENHQKGSGFYWVKHPREELLEGTLLKNAAIMSLGGAQVRDVKENEASARKPAVPMTGVWGKSMAELEVARQREAVNEKTRGIEIQGCGRDEINVDFLRKGKTFLKLRGLDVTSEKEPDEKPIPKLRATAAVSVASKSHGTISQVVGRPFRGGRKPVTIAKDSVRRSEPQAKKRMRK